MLIKILSIFFLIIGISYAFSFIFICHLMSWGYFNNINLIKFKPNSLAFSILTSKEFTNKLIKCFLIPFYNFYAYVRFLIGIKNSKNDIYSKHFLKINFRKCPDVDTILGRYSYIYLHLNKGEIDEKTYVSDIFNFIFSVYLFEREITNKSIEMIFEFIPSKDEYIENIFKEMLENDVNMEVEIVNFFVKVGEKIKEIGVTDSFFEDEEDDDDEVKFSESDLIVITSFANSIINKYGSISLPKEKELETEDFKLLLNSIEEYTETIFPDNNYSYPTLIETYINQKMIPQAILTVYLAFKDGVKLDIIDFYNEFENTNVNLNRLFDKESKIIFLEKLADSLSENDLYEECFRLLNKYNEINKNGRRRKNNKRKKNKKTTMD